MAELNLNQIFDGIASALDAAFPGTHVFGDKVPQNLQEGDFIVFFVDATHPQRTRKRVQRIAAFDIAYFPHEDDLQKDVLQVATQLPAVLRLITTPSGEKVHCSNDIGTSLVDDVLHCAVRYPHFVRETVLESDGGEPGEETDTGLWPSGSVVTGLEEKCDPNESDDPDAAGIDLMYILEHPERKDP